MGCSVSAVSEGGPEKESERELNEELRTLQAPTPHIPIITHPHLKPPAPTAQNVLFIFGGPGSKKGLIIEELVMEFEFTVISTEDIVLSYLPNKVANTVQTTQEIQDLLKTDPGLLTLDWVLHLISAKLSTSMSQNFLIDLVPNLLSIQKAESFSQGDYNHELSNFEKRHVILFALNLMVSTEELGESTPGILMKRNEKEEKEKEKEEKEGGEGGKKEKKSVFETTGSDEADTSRMKRRREVYMSVAQRFMDYFEQTGRLVTLQIGGNKAPSLRKRVSEFFQENGFPLAKPAFLVALFVQDERSIERLDLRYYNMDKVYISSFSTEHATSLESMIRRVRHYMDSKKSSERNFLIVLDKMGPSPDEEHRGINFVEMKENFLEKFIRPGRRDREGSRGAFRKAFRSITTPQDEVCLFTKDVKTETAKRVAVAFGDYSNNNSLGAMGESTNTSIASTSEEDGDFLRPPPPASPSGSKLSTSNLSDIDKSIATLTTIVSS